ncbi:MAG: 4-hydroxy-tetrahydrodipicolinate reductase [Dysgonamonadaceae bacterium]|jgi:4-hydroxy-tetrahydrodipicolinate reductase|nr:4-hydroxy-tetrahydrodipicolinate reductase [Dysgonamonadaceae bacterium]
MNITLIGYGKMGREIEKAALERGHEIVLKIDVNNQADFDAPAFLSSTDVAIEFTRPESAFANYQKCFERHIPVVAGTTGWLEHLDDVQQTCRRQQQTFFYASNYSLGVNLFFALNRRLAQLMNRFPEYDVRMEEIHHIHKLDAPSGTAVSLAEDIATLIDRKNRDNLVIESKRQGEAPGVHEVIYESEADRICIRHEAKNRRGFALGAVLAAEFIHGKTGFFTMNDLLKL